MANRVRSQRETEEQRRSEGRSHMADELTRVRGIFVDFGEGLL